MIKDLQKAACDYKHAHFVGACADSEIHSQNINKPTGDFSRISHSARIKLLDGSYYMIKGMDCVGMPILINRRELRRAHPTRNVIGAAWIFLIGRYGSFLKENSRDRDTRVDKSSSRAHGETATTFHDLVEQGTRFQTIDQVSRPKSANSSGVSGIRVADAFAYCTFQHKMQKEAIWQVLGCCLWQTASA